MQNDRHDRLFSRGKQEYRYPDNSSLKDSLRLSRPFPKIKKRRRPPRNVAQKVSQSLFSILAATSGHRHLTKAGSITQTGCRPEQVVLPTVTVQIYAPGVSGNKLFPTCFPTVRGFSKKTESIISQRLTYKTSDYVRIHHSNGLHVFIWFPAIPISNSTTYKGTRKQTAC